MSFDPCVNFCFSLSLVNSVDGYGELELKQMLFSLCVNNII